MVIAIRHFPDRKRPCIVLEEGNQALVLGYLTDQKREKWLKMALMREYESPLVIGVDSLYLLNDIIASEEKK